MKIIIYILICFFSLSIYGQNKTYVKAKSGLIVRDKPSLEANKIHTLPDGSLIKISEKTGVKLTVIDDGKKIIGEWVQITNYDDIKTEGYVFSGYLTNDMPNIYYSGTSAFYKTYNYNTLKDGTNVVQGYSKEFLKIDLPLIKNTSDYINLKKYPYFFNPYEKEIVLFANHDLNKLKPVAKLKSLVQTKIDSTFYKIRYKDYTSSVWNRIIIDGKPYYTDIDIHDFKKEKRLEKLNQKVIIVGQYDGYDGAYHIGYPEYFFMIFTNDENKIINKTKVLDFRLNEEFALEEDILEISWNSSKESYAITLVGANEKIEVSWNGKTTEIKKL